MHGRLVINKDIIVKKWFDLLNPNLCLKQPNELDVLKSDRQTTQ